MFGYKFQIKLIKLILSDVMYAILAVFNHLVAHKDLEGNSKERNCLTLLTDRYANRLKAFWSPETISAENKYLEKRRENKQIISSLIDFMTGRFYHCLSFYFTLLFFSRNGSTAVPISRSKLDLKACVQNKGVFRRLFGSILISYMIELS